MLLIVYQNLTGKHRNARNNFLLGLILAMIAGAINAGGFFLVMQYTSHMTGLISLAADSAAIGEYFMAFKLMSYITCFIAGATCTTMLVLSGKRYHSHSQFALPLMLEALLLIGFSVLWYGLTPQTDSVAYFIAVLCFVMGLQNALITKVSSAIIRTTHITGMATDLGIELGRMITGAEQYNGAVTKGNIRRHAVIILAFFTGGVLGALGVNMIGVLTFIIIAFLLAWLIYPQVKRDFIFLKHHTKRKRRAV